MKFKYAITKTAPQRLIERLGSADFNCHLVQNVLGELRVENVLSRPAEVFVQEPDLTLELDKGVWGVELTLSKTSIKDGRHFAGALQQMIQITSEAIKQTVPRGQRVQVFCLIQTDIPVPTTSSCLFEQPEAIWMEGEAE